MLWQIALTTLVLAAVLLRIWQKRLIYKCKLQEANVPMVPIFGHALMGVGSMEIVTQKIINLNHLANKQGGVIAFWAGHRLGIAISDPVNAEFVLKNHLDKGSLYSIAKILTGSGSIAADVPIWRQRRKICAPLFSPKNLSLFVEIFSEQSRTMTNLLRESVGKGPTELWPYLMKYTFDAVCISTLGINIDAQNNPEHPFVKSFITITELLSKRAVSPWLYFDTIYKLCPSYSAMKTSVDICYDFVEKVVSANEENYRISPENRKYKIPALTELLNKSNGHETELSVREQCEEVLIFVMAGMDTSASGMSFTLHMLSRHQDVQEKVYQELKDVFGDSSATVAEVDLTKLQYLECVIKETMRLYPPAPLVGRTPRNDVILPSGEQIPKNTFVIIGIYGLNRNPKYWGDDADQFRPERFLEPFKHPKQYMPFSDGPRNCIGYKYAIMSMKTALATLLRQYKIVAPNMASSSKLNGSINSNATTYHPPIRMSYDIIFKDIDNVRLCLEPREIIKNYNS